MGFGLTNHAAREALDAIAANYDWVQLHVGPPGTGDDNVAATSTRKAGQFSRYNQIIDNTVNLVWTPVEDEIWSHFSVWSAETDGDCGWTGELLNGEVTTGVTKTMYAGWASGRFETIEDQ